MVPIAPVPIAPTEQLTDPSTAHDLWKHKLKRPLDVIFRPKSVAIIGASERKGSVGRTLMWNLISNPFGGTIYPVNNKRKSIFGIKAYNSICDVSEQVDLAIVILPAKIVPKIMQECAAYGVKGAIIISAGFKEVGPEGLALEQEVLRIARSGSIRIIGPNCLGVMSPLTGLNATFANRMALPGSVGFISQSGAMCTAILDWSCRENVGFSSFISIGSMLDVDWGDLIYYLGDDTRTKAIVIYMETIGNARSFMSAACEVAMTKPIIVIKPGRTSAAAAAAASHTGSMTGSDEVLDAAFRRCGVLRVDHISEVFNIAELIAKQPRPQGPRLTIITNAGGPGVLATDALLNSGGKLTQLSVEVKEKLDIFLPPHWSHSNPIDILGDATPETYAEAVKTVAQDKNCDGILVVLSPQAMTNPTRTAEAVACVRKSLIGSKPLLTSWMGGEDVAAGFSILNQAGIPTYEYPDAAARMFSYMWMYSRNLLSLYETPHWTAEKHPDSAKAGDIIDHVRKTGRTVLTEWESKQLLDTYGIPTVKTVLACTAEDAVTVAEDIGYPVVVKLNSETITHKSDAGGVQLSLNSADEVRAAFYKIENSIVEKYDKEDFLGVTVQPMLDLSGAYELILGSSPDAQFGPVMLFGSGGTMVEVYKDRSLALPPLNSNLAYNMIRRTKIFHALKGFRGRGTVDLKKLEALMVNFSHLVIKQRWIKEIDINPLVVSSEVMVAVDARIILYDNEEDQVQSAIRPYPSQYEQNWVTKKGDGVLIRPIMPEDEPCMINFHKKLSEESIYKRFFTDIKFVTRVSHDRLVRVCFVDYDRDIALVVFNSNSSIIAAGRLTKKHMVNAAEFSMLVADQFHARGIGTKLLQELVRIGKDEHLDVIEAVILPQNIAMIRVCQKVGFEVWLDKETELVKAVVYLTPSGVTQMAQ